MKTKTLTTLLTLLSLLLLTARPAQAQSPCQTHTVQPGDTISKLAREHLGDPLAYPVIVEATNAQSGDYATLSDPDLIEPGQKLCIPTPQKIDLDDFLDLREKPVKVLFSEIKFQSVGKIRTEIIWRSIAEYPDSTVRECWLSWSSNRDIDGTRISSGCMYLSGKSAPVATPEFRRPQS